MSDKEAKAWEAAFKDCPALKAYATAQCPNGPNSCKRDPTERETISLCTEFHSMNGKCDTHDVVRKMLGSECKGVACFGRLPYDSLWYLTFIPKCMLMLTRYLPHYLYNSTILARFGSRRM